MTAAALREPEPLWHETGEAAAILAALTPAHVHLVARTPIIGARYHEWVAPEHDEALYELRRAFIAESFGKSFAACTNDDERRAYLEFDALHENVGEVLCGLFGSPERLGRPSDLLIDCDRGVGVTAAWRREERA